MSVFRILCTFSPEELHCSLRDIPAPWKPGATRVKSGEGFTAHIPGRSALPAGGPRFQFVAPDGSGFGPSEVGAQPRGLNRPGTRLNLSPSRSWFCNSYFSAPVTWSHAK